jgi:hypothetical protein
MSSAFASSGLKEFDLALDEVTEALDFSFTAAKLRPRLAGVLNRDRLYDDIERLTATFINFNSVEMAPLYRGLLVVVSGAFEQLVRRIVEDAVVRINGTTSVFDNVPEGIKTQNIFFTGRALCAVREPPDHLSINHQTLVQQLATCTAGAQNFRLNAEVFAMFIANLTPSHLTDVCRSIGVKMDWDYFGKLAEFQTLCGTKGTRSTANAIFDRLAESIKLRNRIAHTGAGGVSVTFDTVIAQIEFFRALGPHLAAFVESNLA